MDYTVSSMWFMLFVRSTSHSMYCICNNCTSNTVILIIISDAQARNRAAFGKGTGPIHMDNVNCYSNEQTLLSCGYDPNASEDSHNEDAGVVCYKEPESPTCTSGAVRLVNSGSNDHQGRVEVCVLGVWGSVSDNKWWMIDGNVVCKQLGYAYAGMYAEPLLILFMHAGVYNTPF